MRDWIDNAVEALMALGLSDDPEERTPGEELLKRLEAREDFDQLLAELIYRRAWYGGVRQRVMDDLEADVPPC